MHAIELARGGVKRCYILPAPMTPNQQTGLIRFGPFEADLSSGELRKNGIRIRLPDQSFQILVMLTSSPGQVITREDLRKSLWPEDTFVDFDNGLNSAILRLRNALGDSAEQPRFIETLPRRGYRFIPPVERKLRTDQDPVTAGLASGSTFADQPPSESETTESASLLRSSRTKHSKLRIFAGLATAVLLLVLTRLTWVERLLGLHAALKVQSIAVLPLENLTGDPSQEYFSDGMTDALITELAQLQGLRVISRTSSIYYKGTHKTLPQIGRELQVDAVVEGTVSRGDDTLKITAQLIYAPRDAHLWAASFTGSARDALQLQARVAEDIASQIRDRLTPEERQSVSTSATTDPAAYDDFLKGIYFVNKLTPDDVKSAIRYFRSAIEKDPNFAAAYARLSDCYYFLSITSEMSTADAYKPAREAAEKALALDDKLDRAHTAMAAIAWGYDWDWTRAEAEIKRAIQLNPNSANARFSYSELLLTLGRWEESAEQERAGKIVDPFSLDAMTTTVVNAYYRRNYPEGLVQTRAALGLFPKISVFHVFLSNIHAMQGHESLSAQEILLAEEFGGATPERIAALKTASEIAGLKGLRQKRIELNKKLAGAQPSNAYDIAIDCAAIGDRDQALSWLEKAIRSHDAKASIIAVEPIFDSLRSDPRFVALLQQMGLTTPRLPVSR